jgi:hypothetical protein
LILEQLINKIKRRQLLKLRKISKDSCPAKPTCVYIWIKSHANIEMWKIIKISPLYFKNFIWTKLFFFKVLFGFWFGSAKLVPALPRCHAYIQVLFESFLSSLRRCMKGVRGVLLLWHSIIWASLCCKGIFFLLE